MERRVTWSCRMRARLPAFESVHGGELALLALSQLRRLDESLPHLLKSLQQEGVAAVAVAAPSVEALGEEACTLANQLNLPLIVLPSSASLEVIEREVITFVVSFRGEIERKATEISHQLMQLSIQGAGIQGICEQLANRCNKWVVVQDADHHTRLQAAPADTGMLFLPATLDEELLWQQGLTQIIAPILLRHEVVGYLSLIGNDGDFDYLERIILGQVVPILALEFAREKERSDVESRYQLEAFMDVLQGNYQQPEEMLVRARLLGYDLTTSQIVTIFEIHDAEPEYPSGSPQAQWGRRVRDELLLAWPSCWVLHETRRVTAILPLAAADNNSPHSESDIENTLVTRLERLQARLQQNKNTVYQCFQLASGVLQRMYRLSLNPFARHNKPLRLVGASSGRTRSTHLPTLASTVSSSCSTDRANSTIFIKRHSAPCSTPIPEMTVPCSTHSKDTFTATGISARQPASCIYTATPCYTVWAE